MLPLWQAHPLDQLEADTDIKMPTFLFFLALTFDVSRMMKSEVTDFKRTCAFCRLPRPVICVNSSSTLKNHRLGWFKREGDFFLSWMKNNMEGSLLLSFGGRTKKQCFSSFFKGEARQSGKHGSRNWKMWVRVLYLHFIMWSLAVPLPFFGSTESVD